MDRALEERWRDGGKRVAPVEAWASALAAGIPDSLYWRCTPPEIDALAAALMKRREGEARQAALCAGLVTAAVYNVHRRQGSRMMQPGDFLPEEITIVSPERAHELISGWARSLGSK